MINRDKKIENEVMKPRDELIRELYQENVSLYKELSKQATVVDLATDYEKKHTKMLEDNINLKFKCHQLKESLENTEKELQLNFDNKVYNIESQYKKQIKQLETENKTLNKMIDKFKTTLKKFIKWICHKFSYPSEDEIIRDFEKETYTNFNLEKQLDIKEFQNNEEYFDIEL